MIEGIEESPTEVLIYIFSLLPPKELMKCRQICRRWKNIVDALSNKDQLWLRHCEKDFPSVYATAYYNRFPSMNWCKIYRSLTLWPRLPEAEETRDEFAPAVSYVDEIRDFQVLRRGLIGIHTCGAIKYYDLQTLKPSTRKSISGSYIRYVENDDTIVTQGYNLNLFIFKKFMKGWEYEIDLTLDNVKLFLLNDNELHFVTINDEVGICKLQEEKLQPIYLNQAEYIVMSIGYSNGRLNLLTFERDIFSVVGKELVYHRTLGPTENLLHQLKKYNFLENLDWRVYFQWMFILKHKIPQGPLRDIITVKTYGESVFVGSNWGVLRIYYAPYHDDEFDLFKSEPVKQYNFMERKDCPVLSLCPILQISIIECEDGHMVLVGMPKKIAVIKYKHNFKYLTRKALLTHADVHYSETINS